MLKWRLLTAFILLPLVLLLILQASFAVYSSVLFLIFMYGLLEWTNLMQFKSLENRIFCFLLMVIFLSFFRYVMPALFEFELLFTVFMLWVICFFFIYAYPKEAHFFKNKGVLFFYGIGLIGGIDFSLRRLKILHPYLLFNVLCIVWIMDSGAYFVGKKLGKHKLCPQLSPGKTIEGAIGGLVCLLIYTIISFYFFRTYFPYSWSFVILLNLLTGAGSIIGDLQISLFKRNAQLKDVGHLLPGHGGLLDRIDSLLFAAPFYLFILTTIPF